MRRQSFLRSGSSGELTLWQRLLAALRRRAGLHLCRVFVRPFGAASRRSFERAGGVHYRALSEKELLGWCADAELELRPALVQAACARGDVCLGALRGEDLIGYLWLAFGPAEHTEGIWVEFDERARYSYKKFVRPAYRGLRVAQGLSALADAPAFTRRCELAINFVDLDNRASLRATIRGGSRGAGYAGYLRCKGLTIPFRTPGAWRYGFRFLPRAPRAYAASAATPAHRAQS